MAPPKKKFEEKKQTVSMSLTPVVLKELNQTARKLAVKLERRVTPSMIVESMVRKYVMKEKR